MKTSVLLIVIIVAGAAFAGGYVVGSGPTDDHVLETELADIDTASVEPEFERAIEVEDRPELAANEELSALRAAVASFPPPPPERGDGTITGTVTTSAGAPLAGVEIWATPRRESPKYERSKDPDEALLQDLRRRINNANWTKANRVTTLTGDDGRFALEGLMDREHNVLARLEGWRISASDRRAAREAKPGTELTFNARGISGVKLEVHLPDGTQPEQARTRLKTASSSSGGSWRPDDKVIESQAGLYQLTVTAGEHQEFGAGPIPVEIVDGETTELRVDLEVRPVLSIRIRFPDGEEMGGGQIYRMRVSSGHEPKPAVLKAKGENFSVRHTPQFHRAAEWNQTRTDIKPGTYAIGYMRGHNRSFAVIDMVEVGPGVNEHVIEVPQIARDEYVVVRVRDPKGRPITNADIGSGFSSDNASSSGNSPLINKGEGEYWVLHHAHPWEDKPGGTHWISVRSPGHGTKRVEYTLGSVGAIDIDFDAPASLEVLVKGVAGSDYEGGVKVGLAQGTHSFSNVDTDAEGRALISGVQPGAYDIQIRVGHDHWPAIAHTEPIKLKPGENSITIPLPTLYTITLQGAEGYAWISLKDAKPGMNFHKSAQAVDGEVVLDGIPAGEYTAHSGQKNATFTLPGPTVIVLEAPDGDG